MTEVQRITEPDVIQFPKLGIEFEINPTAFTVFGIEIQWYGLIITIGLIIAALYCFPKMKRFGIDADRGIDAVIGGIIGGIVGARAYYVIWNWEDYKGDIKAIINTRNGGLAIYGGIIGAFAVGLVICRIKKIKMLPMLDDVVLGFLIGQGIGRWGNFVNQEAFGTNTDSIFGMTGGTIQSTILRNSAYLDGSMYQSGIVMSEKYAVHPCFLYESVWCLLGFFIISSLSKKRKYDGQIFLMYLAWYGAERAVVEGLRTDSLMWGNIRVSQALSVIILIVSVVLQIIMISRYKRDPEKYVLYVNTEESRNILAESEIIKKGLPEEPSQSIIDEENSEMLDIEEKSEEN